jgi:hypothetical protein
MSFREKSAWISLVTVVLAFGVYFGAIALGLVSPRGFATLHLLLACVLVMVATQCILHLVAARLSPEDAHQPRDERERLIQLRSHTVGYYLLVAGVLALFFPGHMGAGPIDLMNFALLAVVVAAAAVSATQVVLYRRDG